MLLSPFHFLIRKSSSSQFDFGQYYNSNIPPSHNRNDTRPLSISFSPSLPRQQACLSAFLLFLIAQVPVITIVSPIFRLLGAFPAKRSAHYHCSPSPLQQVPPFFRTVAHNSPSWSQTQGGPQHTSQVSPCSTSCLPPVSWKLHVATDSCGTCRSLLLLLHLAVSPSTFEESQSLSAWQVHVRGHQQVCAACCSFVLPLEAPRQPTPCPDCPPADSGSSLPPAEI